MAAVNKQSVRRFTFELRMETDRATNSNCTGWLGRGVWALRLGLVGMFWCCLAGGACFGGTSPGACRARLRFEERTASCPSLSCLPPAAAAAWLLTHTPTVTPDTSFPALLSPIQYPPHHTHAAAVSVTDSLGDVATSQRISFYTNATRYDELPNQPDTSDLVSWKYWWQYRQAILGGSTGGRARGESAG